MRAEPFIIARRYNYADEGVPLDLTGLSIMGVQVANGMNQHGFGYLLLERDGGGWTATGHDLRGNPVRSCAIGVCMVTCGPQRTVGR